MAVNKNVTQLKKWLYHHKNGEMFLAYKLGYKSAGAVKNWLSRGNIPESVWPTVQKIIKK